MTDFKDMRSLVDEQFRQEPVPTSPLIDLIARAIYEANDADNFDIDDELEQDGMAWYRREAIQVIEALREAGLDLVGDYETVVNVPLPPVSIRPVIRPRSPFEQGQGQFPSPNQSGVKARGIVMNNDEQTTVGDIHDKFYGGNND